MDGWGRGEGKVDEVDGKGGWIRVWRRGGDNYYE